MSARSNRAWISQRGQHEAASAIDQVLTQQPAAHETIQLLDDALIEASPYQARQSIAPEQLEDLIAAMRATGFQGVLIVRSHPDPAQQRHGMVQLVYGHRRRAAWRQVCAEHGDSCQIPVVVRTVSDEQLLLVGAQENLQRHDLNPIEEAQLVTWLEGMFPRHNQAELGSLVGKSSDWVSTRSRIQRLPEPLKACLLHRPRAIAQILELGMLASQDVVAATTLAERVVAEQLTLDAVRALVRGYARPARHEPEPATPPYLNAATPASEQITQRQGAIADAAPALVPASPITSLPRPTVPMSGVDLPDQPQSVVDPARYLQQAAKLLEQVVGELDQLPATEQTRANLTSITAAIARINAHISS